MTTLLVTDPVFFEHLVLPGHPRVVQLVLAALAFDGRLIGPLDAGHIHLCLATKLVRNALAHGVQGCDLSGVGGRVAAAGP